MDETTRRNSTLSRQLAAQQAADHDDSETSGWGGAREGSGRKTLSESEQTVSRSITLTESQWQYVRQFGKTYSAGIRHLIQTAKQD